MGREQVRQVLGTPLLADAFHGDRWDYVYWREDEWGKREMRKLAVFFMDGKLIRIEGDIVASQEPLKEPKEATQ
jgi:outer membrane protein assembly factor BamE